MYQGRHTTQCSDHAENSRYRSKKSVMLILALALVVSMTIGGTIAYLTTQTDGVTNTFNPSKVTCEVTENFNGSTGEKSNVNVKNTGDIAAFIRVKLVTYRTNDQGQHIGGTAEIPAFTLGDDWVLYNGYYYYTKPVAPGDTPEKNLTNSMTLTGSYGDADGGKQAIDVMAEAIQSVPEAAVKAAWGEGFSIGADGNLIVPGN